MTNVAYKNPEDRKKWVIKNRKHLREYKKSYYHKTNLKEKMKEYYYKNLEINREKRRKNNFKRRLEILSFLGNKCSRCSNEDWRVLQVDHVNGGGSKERRSLGNSASSLKKKVHENPSNYQLLCANCNWIKRYENKEQFI